MSRNTLFFFTINYPYREGESFINSEFPFLESFFENIVIITSSPITNRALPFGSHVTVQSIDDILKGKSRSLALLRNFFLIFKQLLREYRSCASPLYFFKNLRSMLSTLLNSIICGDYITEQREFRSDACFYSFWMNNHALTLAMLKARGRINEFVFRVHGYDLILERWLHRYIAFQATCHHYAARICTVSGRSTEYFKKTYSQSANKVETAHLGTMDKGINPSRSAGEFDLTIVSCSNIIPLKRLHLIVDALKAVNRKVNWIHFGDGVLRTEIESAARALPKNIVTDFRGQVTQWYLFDFYVHHHVDLFLNVSDSEGLPFSIIEAVSLGIPVVATDAGGTREIVKEQTGILLPLEFSVRELTDIIERFQESIMITNEYRDGVRDFWKTHFSAEKVYPAFIEKQLRPGKLR